MSNEETLENPNRRKLLKGAAIAPVAVVAGGAVGAVSAESVMALIPAVTQSFTLGFNDVAENVAKAFGIIGDLQSESEMSNGELFDAMDSFMYRRGWITKFQKPDFADYCMNDFQTDDWLSLEGVLHASMQKLKSREEGLYGSLEDCQLGKEATKEALFAQGYDGLAGLNDVGLQAETAFNEAIGRRISTAYAKDPLGFVRAAHKHNTHSALKLHRAIKERDGYDEYRAMWPEDIARHVDSMFHVIGWGDDDVKKKIANLSGQIFPLGVDGDGNIRFHIALKPEMLELVMKKTFGDETTQKFFESGAISESESGDVVLRLGPEEYAEILPSIVDILPEIDEPEPLIEQAQPDGALVSNEQEKESAAVRS